MRQYLTLCAIMLGMCMHLSAQHACSEFGFETGTLDNIDTYHGTISLDGTLNIDIPEVNPSQHRVTLITEGNDPIAESFCDINKILPMVPPGAGLYTLRLGDAGAGARGARVVLEMDVTDANTFFSLNYAVLLEDPNHSSEQQPRFELSVQDKDGNDLPCGQYAVRAMRDLDGFENCGSWRVRPWTAVGFELQSYVGQTVYIEILSTDCARGGHAGYAYFDANCQPLTIELLDYCPENNYADIFVTAGFQGYEWSTGDSTNQIRILDPVPGEIISVEVTSVTGCKLTLSDTIPTHETFPTPVLDPIQDTSLCAGDYIWLKSSGVNIYKTTFYPFNISSDSLLIYVDTTTLITVIAENKFGCESDAQSFWVTINDIDLDLAILDEKINTAYCDDSTGSIELDIDGTYDIKISLDGEHYDYRRKIENLSAGRYTVYFLNEFGCTDSRTYTVPGVRKPSIRRIETNPDSCDRATGQISINARSSSSTLQYSLDNLSYRDTFLFDTLRYGSYTVYVQDTFGCTVEQDVDIQENPSIHLDSVITEDVICDIKRGSTQLFHSQSFPINWSFDLINYSSTSLITDLSKGDYTLYLVNQFNCQDSTFFSIDSIPPAILDSVSVFSARCDRYTGSIDIHTSHNPDSIEYKISGLSWQETSQFNRIDSGQYIVELRTLYGCITKDTINIGFLPGIIVDSVHITNTTCEEDNGVIEFLSPFSSEYLLSLNNTRYSDTSIFSSLSPDLYTLYVKNIYDCNDTIQLDVEEIIPIKIDTVVYTPESCLEDNGSIEIITTDASRISQYSLNNLVQTDSLYEDLASGEYTLSIIDTDGCVDTLEYNLEQIIPPTIESLDWSPATCDLNNATLQINHTTAFGSVIYSLNQLVTDTVSTISNIPPGEYMIHILDELGCRDSIFLSIEKIDPPRINNYAIEEEDCNDGSRNIKFDVVDGCGPTEILMNLNRALDTSVFNIPPSVNELTVQLTDDCNCVVDTIITLPSVASIFIPDLFTPNRDGLNDYFEVQSSSPISSASVSIWDRWGNQVFNGNRLQAFDLRAIWNGEVNGRRASEGVYIYVVDLELINGERICRTGDITLIR